MDISASSSKCRKHQRCVMCCYNGIERKLHRFPKDPERSDQWAKLCGLKWVTQASPTIRWKKFRLCDAHFKPEDYKFNSSRLQITAVPVSPNYQNNYIISPENLRKSLKEKMELRKEADKSIECSEYFFCGTNMTSTPKSSKRSTERVITPKTRKIKILSSKVYYLRRKYSNSFNSKLKLSTILNNIKPLVNNVVYNFISSQLKFSNVSRFGRRWTVEDKNLALQIYLASPKAYRSLSSYFKLPTKKTLMKSIAAIDLAPGFSSSILSAIKLVASKLKKHDKYCVVSFDEMRLKSALSYNCKKDQIDGFENYGNSYYIKNPKLATHALVFMVRGLCKKWKQAFGFFFTCETAPSHILKDLVYEAITKLFECGLIPVATVCDLGANNQRLFSKELNISVDKPFFTVNNNKIYCIFDPPHLLKCLRNNFKKYHVKFGNDKVACWQHIYEMWAFDSKMTHRFVPKLTEQHVTVDGFSKMNVKLAAQVFSHSVASAICYLSVLKRLPADAIFTADFCSTVNDLFDSMNSRVLKHPTKELLSAVTKSSPHLESWQKFTEFIKSIEFQTRGKKIMFPCLKGWQITLSAFLELIPNLLLSIPHILMSRFSQDALENFFGCIRGKGGYNDHPTPSDFIARMKILMAQNMFSTCGTANCEPDNDTVLLPVEVLTNSDSGQLDKKSTEECFTFSNCDDVEVENSTYDVLSRNSASYVGGYIAKKAIKLNDCETCNNDLLGDKTLSEDTLYIYYKEYDDVKKGLYAPSEPLLTTICEFGRRFNELFQPMCSRTNIKQSIFQQLYSVKHDWLHCASHATATWEYIANFYITLMIRYKVKLISRDLKNAKRSSKKRKKL